MYYQAAEVYLSVGLTKEAVDCFIKAAEWPKAKKIAVEGSESDLQNYVDEQYKTFLKNQGNADQVTSFLIVPARHIV